MQRDEERLDLPYEEDARDELREINPVRVWRSGKQISLIVLTSQVVSVDYGGAEATDGTDVGQQFTVICRKDGEEHRVVADVSRARHERKPCHRTEHRNRCCEPPRGAASRVPRRGRRVRSRRR